LIVKTTFKSHFKIKKDFKKNKNKFIFVKNIVVFLLFFKVFLKNCNISMVYNKEKKYQTSLLKAPSRHKKFFHQICFEIFSLKVFFYFLKKTKIYYQNNTHLFKNLNALFERFGSNILNKTRFSTRVSINYSNFFKVVS
jgi:hypothetical protein